MIFMLTIKTAVNSHKQHDPTWGFPFNALSKKDTEPFKRNPDKFNIVRTPNLAKMAAHGVRATMSYSPSSLCGPSRSSIMLERHVGTLDCMRGNFNINQYEMMKPAGYDTGFVEELKLSGYATAYFGKWGLGKVKGGPWNFGFEHYAGQLVHGEAHNYFPGFYFEYIASIPPPQHINDTEALKVFIHENQINVWSEETCPLDPASTCVHINDVMIDKAVDFIAMQHAASKPFFLMFAPTYPHIGIYNRKDAFNGPKVIAPTRIISPDRMNQTSRPQRGHASVIEQHMDRDVGRILALLESDAALNTNTLFVFTSDNGASLAKSQFAPFAPTGGLRGVKGTIYEGGLRVPTVLRWPGVLKAGTVSNVPFALYDLGPTFRELGGTRAAPTKDSFGTPTLSISMWKSWAFGERLERKYIHLELCKTPARESDCSTATLDLRKFYSKGEVVKYIYHLKSNKIATRGEYYKLSSSPQEKKQTGALKELKQIRNQLRRKFQRQCVV